jgi:hypothetical protein
MAPQYDPRDLIQSFLDKDKAQILERPKLPEAPSKTRWIKNTSMSGKWRLGALKKIDKGLGTYDEYRGTYERLWEASRRRDGALLEKLANGDPWTGRLKEDAQRYLDGQKEMLKVYENALQTLKKIDRAAATWENSRDFQARSFKRNEGVSRLRASLQEFQLHASQDIPQSLKQLADARRELRQAGNSLRLASIGRRLLDFFGRVFERMFNLVPGSVQIAVPPNQPIPTRW